MILPMRVKGQQKFNECVALIFLRLCRLSSTGMKRRNGLHLVQRCLSLRLSAVLLLSQVTQKQHAVCSVVKFFRSGDKRRDR